MSESGRSEQGSSRASTVGAWVAAGAFLVAAACGGDAGTGPSPSPSVKEVDLDLSVGESQRITADESVLRVNVPGPGDNGAEYRLAVQSAAESPGTTPMRLSVETDGGSSSAVSARRTVAPPPAVRPGDGIDLRGYGIRSELQKRSLEMLERGGVAPSPGRREVRTQTMLPTGQEPSKDDTLEFWFPVDSTGSIDCDTTQAEKVTATVQAVNSNGEVAMVEGNQVDDGALDEMDYQALADEFDQTVFGTDVAYFGAPSDIDDNQRVLVLFTNKVNEFSAERTEGDDSPLVSGFFLPTDLADSGDATKSGDTSDGACGASNEAEVLWLIAPDPDGSTGEQELTVQQATQLARSTASHEFQHLLNLGNRLFVGGGGFGDAEETWLDEGLSHVAEEIVGLDKSDVVLRDNLTLSDVTGSASQDSVFNTFLISDFANLARHLQSTNETQALAVDDPADSDETLRMRGFAWGFLRWLADRVHAGQAGSTPGTGDPEEQFFRELAGADGSLETGVDNVEASASTGWPTLLADFGLAMIVDDDEPQAPARQQVLTWHLRDVYRGLNQAVGSFPFNREYPLAPTQIGFSSSTTDFEVRAGTGRYFTLSSGGSGPDVALELSDQSGSELTAGSPQITIIRTE